MNNDSVLNEGNVLQPEIVERKPRTPRNLITIMVLSITLANQILGKKAPKNGKLDPGQGKLVIQAIEKAVKNTFPEIAPMILGMFGIEMMTIMPMLKNPDQIVADMVSEYSDLIVPNAFANPQSNMG